MDFSIIIGFIIFCLSFIVIYKLLKNWTIEILMMDQKYSKRDMLTKDLQVATAFLNSTMEVLLSEEE